MRCKKCCEVLLQPSVSEECPQCEMITARDIAEGFRDITERFKLGKYKPNPVQEKFHKSLEWKHKYFEWEDKIGHHTFIPFPHVYAVYESSRPPGSIVIIGRGGASEYVACEGIVGQVEAWLRWVDR